MPREGTHVSNFLVSYDLTNPGRDYDSVIAKIKSLGSYDHSLQSVWLLRSTKSAAEIRDAVRSAGDSNDKILVVELGEDWATRKVSRSTPEWLRTNVAP